MEISRHETYLGGDISVTDDHDHFYDELDKPTLIKILCRKDLIIKQKAIDVSRLQAEVEILKDNNKALQEKIIKLKCFPSASKESGDESNINFDVQDETETEAVKDFGDKPMPDWTSSDHDTMLSISDIVRATAEAELNNKQSEYDNVTADSGVLINSQETDVVTEYVYDSNSGYYYHPSTGYYWDPNSGLFYDYTTCSYYKYNETNGEYEVYGQIDSESQNITAEPIVYDVQSLTSRLNALELDAKTCRNNALAMAENYPPCIRAIIQESEKLCAGTLFIITCAGGTIGRETAHKHCVEIPDIGVSKNHASIEYDHDDSCYKIADLGSQNGTRVNGKRVVQLENNKQPLSHGDVLELGLSTKLLLHIHKGHETCEDCEPGLVQAKLKALNPVKNAHVVMTKEERRQQRNKEMKKIKKKYGLQNSHFENEGAIVNNPDYADKAFLRRKFIGSDNDSLKPTGIPASVHRPISSSNKGHRLLAKMGWKEGQGLGKANAGISEPINVGLRVNQSSGLGSEEGQTVSLDHVQDSSKAKRWSQARQRFNQLQGTSSGPTSQDFTTQNDPPYQSQMKNTSLTSTDLPKTFQSDNRDVPSPLPSSVSLSSSSSLTSSSSSTSNSSLSTTAILKSKPQIKWHKGGTETLSNPGPAHLDNKDS